MRSQHSDENGLELITQATNRRWAAAHQNMGLTAFLDLCLYPTTEFQFSQALFHLIFDFLSHLFLVLSRHPVTCRLAAE